MENLIYNDNKTLDTSKLLRIGDLSFYEGPLLSLFEDVARSNFYLFDWVDRDSKTNRWLIYRVSAKYLFKFLNKEISHLELFNNRPNENIFAIDIDYRNKGYHNYKATKITELPESYLPNSNNFFSIEDCNAYEKIKARLIRVLSNQKSENEYSMPVNVEVFKIRQKKINISNKIVSRRNISLFNKEYFEVLDNTKEIDCYNNIDSIRTLSFNNYDILIKGKRNKVCTLT